MEEMPQALAVKEITFFTNLHYLRPRTVDAWAGCCGAPRPKKKGILLAASRSRGYDAIYHFCLSARLQRIFILYFDMYVYIYIYHAFLLSVLFCLVLLCSYVPWFFFLAFFFSASFINERLTELFKDPFECMDGRIPAGAGDGVHRYILLSFFFWPVRYMCISIYLSRYIFIFSFFFRLLLPVLFCSFSCTGAPLQHR